MLNFHFGSFESFDQFLFNLCWALDINWLLNWNFYWNMHWNLNWDLMPDWNFSVDVNRLINVDNFLSYCWHLNCFYHLFLHFKRNFLFNLYVFGNLYDFLYNPLRSWDWFWNLNYDLDWFFNNDLLNDLFWHDWFMSLNLGVSIFK